MGSRPTARYGPSLLSQCRLPAAGCCLLAPPRLRTIRGAARAPRCLPLSRLRRRHVRDVAGPPPPRSYIVGVSTVLADGRSARGGCGGCTRAFDTDRMSPAGAELYEGPVAAPEPGDRPARDAHTAQPSGVLRGAARHQGGPARARGVGASLPPHPSHLAVTLVFHRRTHVASRPRGRGLRPRTSVESVRDRRCGWAAGAQAMMDGQPAGRKCCCGGLSNTLGEEDHRGRRTAAPRRPGPGPAGAGRPRGSSCAGVDRCARPPPFRDATPRWRSPRTRRHAGPPRDQLKERGTQAEESAVRRAAISPSRAMSCSAHPQRDARERAALLSERRAQLGEAPPRPRPRGRSPRSRPEGPAASHPDGARIAVSDPAEGPGRFSRRRRRGAAKERRHRAALGEAAEGPMHEREIWEAKEERRPDVRRR